MTIKETLIKGINILTENKIEEANLISRILLADILGLKREMLMINLYDNIDKNQENKFMGGIDKIAKGYPLQYLTGKKEFMKMDFTVNENVLIPRADTEILVEEVINLSKGKKDILELCTGSGAISISLAKYIQEKINITATDISEKAIEVAKINSEKLIENQNINFIKSDMFENINGKFDMIVSNPPYIKTEVIKDYLLEYEPKLALDRRRRWT